MKSHPCLSSLLCVLALLLAAPTLAAEIDGAWRSNEGDRERVLLIVDGYWTLTTFERTNPAFHNTMGGAFTTSAGTVTSVIQFDSADATQVGRQFSVQVERRGDTLTIRSGGSVDTWRLIPEQSGELKGVWRISGREQAGKIEEMPLRARRTLKVLTGGRFQWIAINIETGEFSGTGGGTYTYESGTYTEVIEFFSRDNTRVGARLAFEGTVKQGAWHHRGLSSRGDPIYEVWSKLENTR